MSYTVIENDFFDNNSLKINTWAVLMFLLRYENKDKGYAYPSQSMLLKKTGLSKVTLLKCLNELEERGYITIKKSNGENNKYYINANMKNNTNTKISTGTKNSSTEISTDTGTKNSTLQLLNKNNKKEKEKKKTNLDEIIEAYTENDSLKEAIKDFIKMRKTIKKPVTDRSLKLTLNKLDQYGKNDLEKIEILENSIMNCWQRVFELKNKKEPIAVGSNENKNIKVNPSICNNGGKYSRGVEVW